MICAGNPTIFIDTSQLGLCGNEMQREVNTDSALLARCETIRAPAAVRMGLAKGPEEATSIRLPIRQTGIAAKPAAYVASDGRSVGMSSVLAPPTLRPSSRASMISCEPFLLETIF